MKYYQAKETFVADLKDGSVARVTAGQPLPENHELVKRDLAGSGNLFKLMDAGEEEPPKARGRARSSLCRPCRAIRSGRTLRR